MSSLAVALGHATQALQEAGNQEARLEAEVLFMHVVGGSRAYLYSHWTEDLSAQHESQYLALVRQRCLGQPLAYITGHKEFFGLDFHVDKRVLIPRPETELLVECALNLLQKRENSGKLVADIGTGSGAIAVSLAVHCPDISVQASDISPDALDVAAENARRHGVAERITFLSGDLTAPLPGPVDIIIANLPYVREADLPKWCGSAQVELAWEPEVALDGGQDGLVHIRRLIRSAPGFLKPGGACLLEIGFDQSAAATELCAASFPDACITSHKDLAGQDRMVSIQLSAAPAVS